MKENEKKTIKRTYCPKELCHKLDKLGINVSSVRQYEKGGGWYNKYGIDVVCKWLREKYGYHLYATFEGGTWKFVMQDLNSGRLNPDVSHEGQKTYEQAILLGIDTLANTIRFSKGY